MTVGHGSPPCVGRGARRRSFDGSVLTPSHEGGIDTMIARSWGSTESASGSEATVAERRPPGDATETAELARLRRRIDVLDRRIVKLLNERAELARGVGRAKAAAGRRGIRDIEREREILLRIAMANAGPMPQADVLAIYRRLFSATRALEAADRRRAAREAANEATEAPGRRAGRDSQREPGDD